MKKKIVAAVLAGVLALTGIVPFIAETFSVRAEEASVIGEWFGNIWGTPAVMTLDKDGAFSIKYDNKDKTELNPYDINYPDHVCETISFKNGRLCSVKEDVPDLEGKCCFEWRQGVKHDCARLMELEKTGESFYRNKNKEKVCVLLVTGMCKCRFSHSGRSASFHFENIKENEDKDFEDDYEPFPKSRRRIIFNLNTIFQAVELL